MFENRKVGKWMIKIFPCIMICESASTYKKSRNLGWKKKETFGFLHYVIGCCLWQKTIVNSQSRHVIISHEENELDIEYIKLDILYFFLYNVSFPSFLSINFFINFTVYFLLNDMLFKVTNSILRWKLSVKTQSNQSNFLTPSKFVKLLGPCFISATENENSSN